MSFNKPAAKIEKQSGKNIAQRIGPAIHKLSTRKNSSAQGGLEGVFYFLGNSLERYGSGRIPDAEIFFADYENENVLSVGLHTCFYDNELKSCILMSVDQNMVRGQVVTYLGEEGLDTINSGKKFKEQNNQKELMKVLTAFRELPTLFTVDLETGRLVWTHERAGNTTFELGGSEKLVSTVKQEEKQVGMFERMKRIGDLEIIKDVNKVLKKGRLKTGELQLTSSLSTLYIMSILASILIPDGAKKYIETVYANNDNGDREISITEKGEKDAVVVKYNNADRQQVVLTYKDIVVEVSLAEERYESRKTTV